jgi:hypothetical protein
MKSRPQTTSPRRSARRGFSFTEVLFAVMILGVGFIMIAAIFPVAIQQSRTTSEEGNAAAIARGAVTFIQDNLTSVDMPALGVPGVPAKVQSFRDPQTVRTSTGIAKLNNETQVPPGSPPGTLPHWQLPHQLWNKVRGNLIVGNDPRYAWVPLYRRDMLPGPTATTSVPSPYAQVFVIVTQVRNELPNRSGTNYAPGADLHTTATAGSTTPLVNLQARPVQVTILPAAQDRIVFLPNPERTHTAVAEGSYVIIANDNLARPNTGRMNGRIYRIGNPVEGVANTWFLMPGNDFVPEPARTDVTPNQSAINGLAGADAFIVGKTYMGTGTGSDPFQGPAQDVAVYTTFIQVR